jgi:hypothetical protein
MKTTTTLISNLSLPPYLLPPTMMNLLHTSKNISLLTYSIIISLIHNPSLTTHIFASPLSLLNTFSLLFVKCEKAPLPAHSPIPLTSGLPLHSIPINTQITHNYMILTFLPSQKSYASSYKINSSLLLFTMPSQLTNSLLSWGVYDSRRSWEMAPW